MESNKTNKILIVVVVAILIGWGATIVTFRNLSKENDQKENIVYVNENEEQLDNFTKKDAVDTLGKILEKSYKDIDGKERKPEERIKELEKNDDITKVIDKDVLDMIYFDSKWGENIDNQIATAIGLIIQSNLVGEMSDGDFSTKLPVKSDKVIILDEVNSKAFVRLDVFVGGATGVSMEMEYIDGEWKLDPYTLVSTMELTDMIFYQIENSQ